MSGTGGTSVQPEVVRRATSTGAPQCGQVAPAPVDVPDNAVVAKVGGKDITAAEARKLVAGAPPQILQAMTQNPQPALEYLLTLQKLQDMATADKIMYRAPWKDLEPACLLRLHFLLPRGAGV